MDTELSKEDLEKVLEEFRRALILSFNHLGLYIHSRFKKDIGIESCRTREDVEIGMSRVCLPVLEKVDEFTKRFNQGVEQGISFDRALGNIKEDTTSQEDKEVFEIFRRMKVVERGLKRSGSLKKHSFRSHQENMAKLKSNNPDMILSEMDKAYDFFHRA
jgi:hypothetical protein